MDKNNLSVKHFFVRILSIFPLCLRGRFLGRDPQKDDLWGEWKSQYDEILTLNKDGFFVVKNLRLKILFGGLPIDSFKEEIINGEGEWNIEKKYEGWRLQLRYLHYTINDMSSEKGCNDEFYIYGSGLLRNRRPYKIHSWDEDDFDYSVFQKNRMN